MPQRWREQTRTPASAEVIDAAARLITPQERLVYQVVKGGGRVTAGTDAPINPYGLSLLMELEHYASGGLTPAEVLRTATTVSADAMGAGADLGSIEPGRLADLTLIDGNPLKHHGYPQDSAGRHRWEIVRGQCAPQRTRGALTSRDHEITRSSDNARQICLNFHLGKEGTCALA